MSYLQGVSRHAREHKYFCKLSHELYRMYVDNHDSEKVIYVRYSSQLSLHLAKFTAKFSCISSLRYRPKLVCHMRVSQLPV